MARTRRKRRSHPKLNPTGTLSVTRGGYGFVQTAEGEYFIAERDMNGAFDGDTVELFVLSKACSNHQKAGGARNTSSVKPVARIRRVLKRAHESLIGRYEVAEPFGVVVPLDNRINYDIFTHRADNPDIADGSLVRVSIIQFPTAKTAAFGTIEEVLGHPAEKDLGVEAIIGRHKLAVKFPDKALAEANQATLDEAGAYEAGYRDLTERVVFTIDPADAKDFDDAVSLDAIKGVVVDASSDSADRDPKHLWRMGVHIADVSHYVPENSALDWAARLRGCSVYLVDRVLPMLPEALSDDLCSLKPHELRRTLTVDIYFDRDANVKGYDIFPAMIRSAARLTYDEAQAIIEGKNIEMPDALDAQGIHRRIRQLSKIAEDRASMRRLRGGLDLDTKEAKVRLDGKGRPLAIDLVEKNQATSLIEEAMICANEVVASYLTKRRFPCIYRVHEKPTFDSLEALVPVFQEFAWFDHNLSTLLLQGNAHAMQRILELSHGRTEGELVSSLLLRAMQRAVYRPENRGHFGLASEAYCHFTSPIRRYPDLEVHRLLKAQLEKRPAHAVADKATLATMCERSSEAERVAELAARQSQELKIIEYLQSSIGEKFSALISGVSSSGIYVTLDNTAVGFIPIRSLGREYFLFDATYRKLEGEETGRVFRLGHRVAVVLVEADPLAAKLEFKIA